MPGLPSGLATVLRNAFVLLLFGPCAWSTGACVAADWEGSPTSADVEPAEALATRLAKTSDPFERQGLALDLASRGAGAAEVVPLLRSVANDEPLFARLAVCRAIWRISGDLEPILAACDDALADGDAAMLVRAATLLGEIGPEAAPSAPELRTLLSSETPILRVRAAEALVRITPGDLAPVLVLVNELDVGSPSTCTEAVYALAAVAPVHRDLVIDELELVCRRNDDEHVRAAALITLAEFDAHPAVVVANGARSTSVTTEALPPRVRFPVTQLNDDMPPVDEWSAAPTEPTIERERTANPSEFELVAGRTRRLSGPPEIVPLRSASNGRPRLALGDDPRPAPVPEVAPRRRPNYFGKPLSEVTADITIEDPELAAFAEERWAESEAVELAYEGYFVHAIGTARPWVLQTGYWEPSKLAHNPLYFENPNSERYGMTYGKWIQPIVEAGRFYGAIPILPYQIGATPLHERQYVLGYYRPGDNIPKQYHGSVRIKGWKHTIRGGLYQAVATVGLIYIIP